MSDHDWIETEAERFIMRTATMDFNWRSELVAFARDAQRRAYERAAELAEEWEPTSGVGAAIRALGEK